jgi:DNA-binding MarR family transcriptional regulator
MEITMRLYATAIVQKAAQSRFFRLKGVEHSLARYTVLRILFFADGRPISQKDISDQTRATQANVTYLIGVLEREGLVERVQDDEDRRYSYVRLTPEGHELAAMIVPVQVEFMTQALRNFDHEEKVEFIRLLEKYLHDSEDASSAE